LCPPPYIVCTFAADNLSYKDTSNVACPTERSISLINKQIAGQRQVVIILYNIDYKNIVD